MAAQGDDNEGEAYETLEGKPGDEAGQCLCPESRMANPSGHNCPTKAVGCKKLTYCRF
jgi:hypothetical protein